MKKHLLGLLVCLLVVPLAIGLSACGNNNNNNNNGGDDERILLSTPRIGISDNIVHWSAVENAQNYTIFVWEQSVANPNKNNCYATNNINNFDSILTFGGEYTIGDEQWFSFNLNSQYPYWYNNDNNEIQKLLIVGNYKLAIRASGVVNDESGYSRFSEIVNYTRIDTSVADNATIASVKETLEGLTYTIDIGISETSTWSIEYAKSLIASFYLVDNTQDCFYEIITYGANLPPYPESGGYYVSFVVRLGKEQGTITDTGLLVFHITTH